MLRDGRGHAAAPWPAKSTPPTSVGTTPPPCKLSSGSDSTDTLDLGGLCTAGQGLVAANGDAQVIFESNGDFVLYRVLRDGAVAHSRWEMRATDRSAHPGGRAVLQTDGNFVVSDARGKVMWASGTTNAGHHMVLQNDCNLVLYGATHEALWYSGTAC